MDDEDDGPATLVDQLDSDYLDLINAGTPITHDAMLARFPGLTPDEQEIARHTMAATDWFVAMARKAGLRLDALATTGVTCSRCGAGYKVQDSGWRYTGTAWEHKCLDAHPQAGYWPAAN